jgi:anti-sigma B factor antagonist
MEIAIVPSESCTVVDVGGYVGGKTAAQLEAALQPLIAGRQQGNVVLDLADVTEMSSAGLRVLISAIKQARARDQGDVRLAAPSPRVVEVLALAGLSKVIRIYDSRDAAVASFQEALAP